jgi:hypothetical protein
VKPLLFSCLAGTAAPNNPAYCSWPVATNGRGQQSPGTLAPPCLMQSAANSSSHPPIAIGSLFSSQQLQNMGGGVQQLHVAGLSVLTSFPLRVTNLPLRDRSGISALNRVLIDCLLNRLQPLV